MANPNKVFKKRTEILIRQTDGSERRGTFFTAEHQRILDVLNDARHFVPFEDSRGITLLINKAEIREVEPIEQTDASAEMW